MKKGLWVFAVAVVGFLYVPVSQAQIQNLKEGREVRLTPHGAGPGERVTGIVDSLLDDRIYLRGGDSLQVFHLAGLKRLEVKKRIPRFASGALTGAAVGGVVIGFLTMESFDDLCLGWLGCNQTGRGELFWEGMRAGMVFGGLIGLAVGGVQTEQWWKRVRFTAPLSPAPGTSDPSVGLAVSWPLR